MSNVRSIRGRIRTVGNIRDVTRTMRMVAAVRFKRAAAMAGRRGPFAIALAELISEVVWRGGAGVGGHPLLAARPGASRAALLVLTGNRGLCGGHNARAVRRGLSRREQLADDGLDVELHVVGTTGIESLRNRGVELAATYDQFDGVPKYADVVAVADPLMDDFTGGGLAVVEAVHGHFVSAARLDPVATRILPLAEMSLPGAAPPDADGSGAAEYDFVPSPGTLLQSMVPTVARLAVFQCFLDAAVSEQMARTTAMRAATDNAEDMVRELRLRYHRLRQSAVTRELAEILGGAEADVGRGGREPGRAG